jgi:SHS2 domain-containing protein
VSELEDCCGTVLVSCCAQKLVAEAWGQLEDPEGGERPPLEAVTRKLVKILQAEGTYVCVVVNCGV